MDQQFTQFVGYQSAPHSGLFSYIDGIVVKENDRSLIEESIGKLKQPTVILTYTKESPEQFLLDLMTASFQEKIIFIFSKTLTLDPLVYNEFLQIRLHNRFTFYHEQVKDCVMTKIPAKTHIFFLYETQDGATIHPLSEIADHVLDMRSSYAE